VQFQLIAGRASWTVTVLLSLPAYLIWSFSSLPSSQAALVSLVVVLRWGT
jgi:hypothetical protein